MGPTEPAATDDTARAGHVTPVALDDFDWSADYGPAARLRTTLEAATSTDGASPLDEAALLRLRHEGLAGSSLWLGDPPAEGFAWLHVEAGELALDVAVDPAHRRTGLGTALVEAALAGTDRLPVNAWAHGNHPGAAALAAGHGFERVRDLWVMRRPTSQELPPLRDIDGIDVRPFVPGQDEEAFLALNAEAFAGHPEQGRMTRADLDQRMAEAWFDPGGFFVAEPSDDRGNLIGFHWTKVHDESPGIGEVYVVGVSPHAQGSGLGRLLTRTGLDHLARRGLTEVLLYVEADNAPARAVYERLGFSHADADTHVQYRRG
ncbi:mycothiol synthase [Nocardioides mesophilus]|uniref:Mycothiol acetyltransferase n=1 Tax=Nocardioides mesophilus TaxID=433659 RepID=A0A7G9REN0_9ACTN|nr:mycothiol synthase [Nocardioides mesophilus]QNN54055.1 mycothiol synthase [Nocardioides mesophilus]